MDTSDDGTKSDPDGALEIYPQKIFFPKKSIRIALLTVFLMTQNDFHEDRFNFPV
jgi:hypothetical protein